MLARIANWLRNALRLRRTNLNGDADLDAEIRSYAYHLADEKARDGMSASEARRTARAELGGIAHASLAASESIRESRPGAWLESFAQDVRYAARLLRKSPGFTIVAVLTLALGIGAGTALFSAWQAALVFPYDFEMNGRWVAIHGGFDRQQASSWFFSASEYADLRQVKDVFADVSALQHVDFNLTDSGHLDSGRATALTVGELQSTGVAPLLGRAFLPGEDAPGSPNVVIISDRFWHHRYQGDPQIIGRSIPMDGASYTIVGVMPARFLLWGTDMWIPLRFDPNDRNRSNRTYWVTAMVRPGISPKQVNARLALLAQQWESDHRAEAPEYAGLRLWCDDIMAFQNSTLRNAMLVLLAAIALLLVITCANVANLLLSRAHARRREVSVRLALGARRGRIVRQFLIESMILSALGGACGFLVAWWSVPQIGAMVVDYVTTEAGEFKVNWQAFCFALGLSLLIGLLYGVFPALHASKASLLEALKATGKQGGGNPRARFARRTLVAAETCLSIVILVAAGLVIRSYARLSSSDPGFSSDHVYVISVPLPPSSYPQRADVESFYQALQSSVAALPGTHLAALTSWTPIADRLDRQDFHIAGRPADSADGSGDAVLQTISADYFTVMGISIKEGRVFSAEDRRGSRNVVIVNQSLAKRYWPHDSPLGREIELGNQYSERVSASGPGAFPVRYLIVGVAGDTRQTRDSNDEILPQVYAPFLQSALVFRSMELVVRADSSDSSLTSAVRGIVARLDPALPVRFAQPMSEVVRDAYGTERLALVLLTIFAAAALVIAMAGIYAVLAYEVARQTHEIGIRMAVGARRFQVLRTVMVGGLTPALAGAALGLCGALAATHLMNDLLYGIAPFDPLTFSAVTLLLLLVATVACYIPARRAMCVDPVVALRHE
jgi:predicted permease